MRRGEGVFCFAGPLQGCLDTQCGACRLLNLWIRQARVHGVKPHQVVNWVRRKLGADICVYRQLCDGTLGCATPCLLCQRELLRFDMRVHVSQTSTLWFSGRLSDFDAPLSQLTGMQRRSFGRRGASLHTSNSVA